MFELMYFLPKNWLSRFVGFLVSIETPRFFAMAVMKWFVARYNLNVDEAENDLESYPSLSQFFVRKLKEGVRPVNAEAWAVHCADSDLTQVGKIELGKLIQAKGRKYSLEKFLADRDLAFKLDGGWQGLYYLCPTDYHRVHSPVAGWVSKVTHIPGQLWPVNDWSVNRIEDLFAVNERVVVEIETEKGKLVFVMVGATNVGQMSLAFEPEVSTNIQGVVHSRTWTYKEGEKKLEKGEELGAFHMGSTVVLLMEKCCLPADRAVEELSAGGPVRVGQKLF